MQSSRQKKKSSQQRKRHHEHMKAKGLTKGTSSKEYTEKDEGKSTNEEGKSTNEEANPQAIPQATSLSKTKDTKQTKMGSNWDRYQEPENKEDHSYYQDNEAQLQQRLVQLLNLPVHHVTPLVNHLPCGADTSSSHVPYGPDSDSFLSLDCAALAESLSSIPLHQVLEISPDLVQLCEMDADQPRTADSALTVTMPPPEIDLSVCTKRAYAFEFKVPPRTSLASDTSAAGENDQLQSACDDVPSTVWKGSSSQEDVALKSLLEDPVVLPELHGRDVASGRRNSNSGPKLDCPPEDETLDRLLAGQTVEPTASGMPTQGLSKGLEPTPSGGVAQDLDVTALDDMLDELLS